MCLAIPVRITEVLDAERARASIGGIVREISVALVEDVAVGDYVILHVGYALSKLDPQEAARTLAAMEAAGTLADTLAELAGGPSGGPVAGPETDSGDAAHTRREAEA